MINKENLIAKEETTKENRVWVRISAACNEKCLFCLDSEAQDGRLIPEDIVKKQIREGFRPGYTNRVILSG
jgi:tRNA A37 methylthiotransferase MiaB